MTDTPAIITRPTQAEVNYKSHADGNQCQHCRWFAKADDGGPYCHVVTLTPEPIAAEGSCDRHETLTPDALLDAGKEVLPLAVEIASEPPSTLPEFADETVVIDNGVVEPLPTVVDDEATVILERPAEPAAPVNDKAALVRIWNGIKARLTGDSDDSQASGIKVYGDRWFAWWSNAYEDREKEFFPAKAIDDYIARVDMGIVPYPELWVWHVPGSKHGQADWLGRIGNFAVASGTFDDTPAGRHAKAAYQRRGQRYQMSHGFFYDTARKQDGVYHQFNTFELTTIPAKAKAAANSFTDFEGADLMKALTPEKKAELDNLLGKEVADELVAKTEAKDKAVTEFGVAFKDFVAVEDVNVETEASKEAAAAASKDFTTLLVDLVGDHAHVSTQVSEAMKAVIAYKATTDETVKGLREQVAKLQEALDGRPRSASKDEATELTKARLETISDEVNKQGKTIDSFWGTEVTKLD